MAVVRVRIIPSHLPWTPCEATRALVQDLEEHGIVVQVEDQASPPSGGWLRWWTITSNNVDFVLLAGTPPGTRPSPRRRAAILALSTSDQAAKWIPVAFAGAGENVFPQQLYGTVVYTLPAQRALLRDRLLRAPSGRTQAKTQGGMHITTTGSVSIKAGGHIVGGDLILQSPPAALTLADLRSIRDKVRKSLRARYTPDLHVIGEIEHILNIDLLHPTTVEGRRRDLEAAAVSTRRSAKALRELATTLSPTDVIQPRQYLAAAAAIDDLTATFDAAVPLFDRLGDAPPPLPDLSAVHQLRQLLSERQSRGSLYHYDAEGHVSDAINASETFERHRRALLETANPRALIGPPGCGKTHAIASIVDAHLAVDLPAVLLVAREYNPTDGAQALLARVLDRQGAALGDMLAAIAALAERPSAGGFTRGLLVIDGIEESVDWPAWQPVLDELVVRLQAHPRLHLVVTMRPRTADDLTLTDFSRRRLPPSTAALDLLFDRYCQYYGVDASAVPWLPWALDSPFAIRLFARLYKNQRVSLNAGFSRSIVDLLAAELRQIEADAHDKAPSPKWSRSVELATHVLRAVCESSDRTWVPEPVVLALAARKDPECTPERVRHALAVCEAHGMLEARSIRPADLAPAEIQHRIAEHHIGDYLLGDLHAGLHADAVSPTTQCSAYPEILRHRDNAANVFAARLAERDIYVIDDIWIGEPPSGCHINQLVAFSWIDPAIVVRRMAWIESLLLRTTADNRAVIESLIVPVSRIPGHPCGPRLLDRVLRGVPMAVRDPIWSVPDLLRGPGPWAGSIHVLTHVDLDPVLDPWDGRPLLLAWTCASVDESRRRQAREALAHWGSMNLGAMIRLLDHMADLDDPQILEDLTTATRIALLGAPVDVDVSTLAQLIDVLMSRFLADDAATWTPDVIVRQEVRTIVEQIALLHPGRFAAALAACRPPYTLRGPEWPPIDSNDALSQARQDWSPTAIISNDFDAYRADECWEVFSEELDLTATHDTSDLDWDDVASEITDAVLAGELQFDRGLLVGLSERSRASAPATTKTTRGPSPALRSLLQHACDQLQHAVDGPAVRNGMLAAQVRAFGWSREQFASRERVDEQPIAVDDAIRAQHFEGRNIDRSAVATFQEKYIWLAVNAVAGMLVDRLPVRAPNAAWVSLDDLSRVGTPRPPPGRSPRLPAGADESAVFTPEARPAPAFAAIPNLVKRANRWLRDGPDPDLERLIRGPLESWTDGALVMLDAVYGSHEQVLTQRLWITALAAPRNRLAIIRRDLPVMRTLFERLFNSYAEIQGTTYHDPSVACWAPWLTIQSSSGYVSLADRPIEIDLISLATRIHAASNGNDSGSAPDYEVYMPAPILRDGLGVVRSVGRPGFSCFVNRSGQTVAIHRASRGARPWKESQHHLVTGFGELLEACERQDMSPLWAIRLYREPEPSLWMRDGRHAPPKTLPIRERDAYWVALWNTSTDKLEIHALSNTHTPFKTG